MRPEPIRYAVEISDEDRRKVDTDAELSTRPHLRASGRKRRRAAARLRLQIGRRQPSGRWRMPGTIFGGGKWTMDGGRLRRQRGDNRPRSVRGQRDTPRYLRGADKPFWPPFSRPLSPRGIEILGHEPRPRKARR